MVLLYCPLPLLGSTSTSLGPSYHSALILNVIYLYGSLQSFPSPLKLKSKILNMMNKTSHTRPLLISVASSLLTPYCTLCSNNPRNQAFLSHHVVASKCLPISYLPLKRSSPLLNLGISKQSFMTQLRHYLLQKAFPDTHPVTPGDSLSLCQLPAPRL